MAKHAAYVVLMLYAAARLEGRRGSRNRTTYDREHRAFVPGVTLCTELKLLGSCLRLLALEAAQHMPDTMRLPFVWCAFEPKLRIGSMVSSCKDFVELLKASPRTIHLHVWLLPTQLYVFNLNPAPVIASLRHHRLGNQAGEEHDDEDRDTEAAERFEK